MLITGKHKRRL